MAYGWEPAGAGDHASSDEEALLNETWLAAQECEVSVPTGNMKSPLRTGSLAQMPDALDNGNDLALECRGEGRDLDGEQLRAQGHEVALQRSFSPLAAIGLGFRYIALINYFSKD